MVAFISSTDTEAPFLYSVAFLIGTCWNAQAEREHGDQVAEPSRACKIHVHWRLPPFETARVSLISAVLYLSKNKYCSLDFRISPDN